MGKKLNLNYSSAQRRAVYLMGENPIWQGDNHTTSNNLGLLSVMAAVKRRKLGSRATWRFSTESG